jgi:murein DD-endopeptidase MepM/ murein hydrolase activator NlpD
MKKPLRPKRLFVHLSDYDDSFVVKKRDWTPLKRVLIAIGLTPAFITFIFPSYKLARTAHRDPTFEIPTQVHAGEPYVIPMTDEVITARANGRPLGVTSTNPKYYFGTVDVDEAKGITLDFAYASEPQPKKTKWLDRLTTHPTVYYYQKIVAVVPAPSNVINRVSLPTRVIANYDTEEGLDNNVPAEVVGGPGHTPNIEASCWKAPLATNMANATLLPFGVMRSKVSGSSTSGAYRHIGVDLFTSQDQTVMSAGAGQVIAVLDKPHPGRTVIISHGGTLFSRYTHLKEAIVRKGDRVKAGSEIGTSGPGRKYDAPRLHWDIFFAKKPVNPQSLLALSARLCEPK